MIPPNGPLYGLTRFQWFGAIVLVSIGCVDFWKLWRVYYTAEKSISLSQPQGPDQLPSSGSDTLLTRLYFAAPLFTQSEWQWNERVGRALREQGFDVTLPQEGALPMLRRDIKLDSRQIFDRNKKGILEADVVLAVLDGADLDSGVCWECGFAFHAGRPILGLRTDFRVGGDFPGRPANLMVWESCAETCVLGPADRSDLSWLPGVARQLRAIIQSNRPGSK